MRTPWVRGTLALAVVLVPTIALVATRVPGSGGVYALVGGRVMPVSGGVIDGGTVVIRDGLIESVGSTAPPVDARVVDAKGLTLTPGIIDGFGGIGLPAPTKENPANPLAPQTLVLDRVRVADALKARDSGITTALVVPREGVLPGRSVLLNLSGPTADAMVLRQPAFLHLHMTTVAAKYPGSLMGTVA